MGLWRRTELMHKKCEGAPDEPYITATWLHSSEQLSAFEFTPLRAAISSSVGKRGSCALSISAFSLASGGAEVKQPSAKSRLGRSWMHENRLLCHLSETDRAQHHGYISRRTATPTVKVSMISDFGEWPRAAGFRQSSGRRIVPR
ncbi:unnamed protein product [Heligmosomoides polygyrus]|uniref:Uncharacterized protein n=1 Tax=Heligmosomoides polygyrus TaxID=6339 RepID=A0A183GAP2_HELPZ|nr:unnamed protein product [Heligmosomoides polygyrus]